MPHRPLPGPATSRGWKSLLLAPCLASALVLGPLNAAAAKMDKEELQGLFTQYLDEQGYRPSVTDLGNISFKSEGWTYVIYVDEKDADFFRMTLSFKNDDASESGRQRRLEALNIVNRKLKAVKGYLAESGSVAFGVEIYQREPGEARESIPRMLRALRAAVKRFNDEMKS